MPRRVLQMNGGLLPQTGSRRSAFGKLVALGLICGALILSTYAPARSCPVTNVDCVVDKTQGKIDDTLDDANGTVEDAASGVGETVDGVSGGAGEDVGNAIDDAIGTPDDLPPNPVSGPVLTSDPGVDPTGAGTSGATLHSGSPGEGNSRGNAAGAASGSASRNVARLTVARAAASETESAAPVAQSIGSAEGGLAEAVRRFAFPLILSALVGVFLFFQNLVDRRDPKLALAPLDTEMILFE
jgi:hypothetical protein